MFYGFLFFFGMILGSFGSVLSSRLGEFTLNDIFRGNKKLGHVIKSILRGRSACPNCHHMLHAIDLIPVISYASTGGKCRYCKKKIPIIYPLREVGCGILFVIIGGLFLTHIIHLPTPAFFLLSPNGIIHLIMRLVVSWLLYLLLIYDIQTMYLHEPLWLLTALATIALIFSAPQATRYVTGMRSAIALCFFFCLYWFARFYVRIRFKEDGEGFGSGDVRLAPLIGVQFGLLQALLYGNDFSRLQSSMDFVYYIILASILGLLYAGIHKLLAPKESVRSIPFFPGMIVALWIMMVWLAI